MRPSVRLAYLDAIGRFKSGNIRYYYRIKGRRVAMPDLPPNHSEFIAAYAAARGSIPIPTPKHPSGTIGAGVSAYLASDVYLALAFSTRAQRRRIASHISESRGAGTLETLEPRHIRKDLAEFTPGPALNR